MWGVGVGEGEERVCVGVVCVCLCLYIYGCVYVLFWIPCTIWRLLLLHRSVRDIEA